MTIVTSGAITDTWNISIYTHIMNINTTGCIPPNKIPSMTIVTSGAIRFLIYIHIDINTTGCIPPNKIPSMTIVTFGAIRFLIYIHIDINTTGCIPPNKISSMTIVPFWAITDTWNVSIYIHIRDINTTAPHL